MVDPKTRTLPEPAADEETRKDWEDVQVDTGDSKTQRLRIPGGWLYRTIILDGGAVAMTFVPSFVKET